MALETKRLSIESYSTIYNGSEASPKKQKRCTDSIVVGHKKDIIDATKPENAALIVELYASVQKSFGAHAPTKQSFAKGSIMRGKSLRIIDSTGKHCLVKHGEIVKLNNFGDLIGQVDATFYCVCETDDRSFEATIIRISKLEPQYIPNLDATKLNRTELQGIYFIAIEINPTASIENLLVVDCNLRNGNVVERYWIKDI